MAKVKKRSREDKSIIESAATLRTRIGDDDSLPRTISFSQGKRIYIQTNTYKLSLGSQSKINQYSVRFEPEILNARANLHYVYSALCGPDAGPMSLNPKWRQIIYDEGGIVYSVLKDLKTEVDVPAGDKTIKVKIDLVKELTNTDSEQLLQVYNTAFHKAYKSYGLSPFRQKWIDERSKKDAGAFTIFSGYRPTIMNLSVGLSYVIDMTTRIDRQDTLYQFLRSGIRDAARREELERACKGFQIQTTHMKKNKGVLVKRIEWGKTPFETVFTKVDKKTKTEQQISIGQYFQETYNHRCENDDLLIVQGGGGKESMYPSSCLKATGISDSERKDRRVMQDIAQVTRIEPPDRKQKLDAFVNSLKSHAEASKFLTEWNINLGEGQSLEGYIIPPPPLQFGARGQAGTPANLQLTDRLAFQQELKNYSLTTPPQYTSPCLILYPEDQSRLVHDDFVNSLRKVSSGLGLILPNIECRGIPEPNPGPNYYIQAVIEYIREIQKRPSFVVCALPTAIKSRYDTIKQYLVVTFGIPSQFFVIDKLRQGKITDSVTTNVAIQIASKTMGVPCTLR